SAVLTAMTIYKKSESPFTAFLASRAGFIFLVAVLALVISSLVVVYQVRSRFLYNTKQVVATVVLNIWSVLLLLLTAEIVIRAFTVNTPEGPMFAGRLVLPRSWVATAARNQSSLAKALVQGSYLIYDNELGWTVGPARRSKDYNREYVRRLLSPPHNPQSISDYPARLQRAKMDSEDSIYLSSLEGIRSPRVGMSFAS